MYIVNEPHRSYARNNRSWLKSVSESDLLPGGILILPKEVYGIDEYGLDPVKNYISEIVIPTDSKLTFTTHLDKVINNIKQIKVGESTYKVVCDRDSFYRFTLAGDPYFMVDTSKKIASLKSALNTTVYNGYRIEFSSGKIAGDKLFVAHDNKQDKWLYANEPELLEFYTNDLELLEFKVNYAQWNKKLGQYLDQGKVNLQEAYNIIRLTINLDSVIGCGEDTENIFYKRFFEIIGDNRTFDAKELLCRLQGQSRLEDKFKSKSYNDCANCSIVAQKKVCNAQKHCISFGKFR